MTTGTDRNTDPAVMQAAVLPTPAMARAKNRADTTVVAVVSAIANVRPRLLASISASASLASLWIGPDIAASAMARIRCADPGTIAS